MMFHIKKYPYRHFYYSNFLCFNELHIFCRVLLTFRFIIQTLAEPFILGEYLNLCIETICLSSYLDKIKLTVFFSKN